MEKRAVLAVALSFLVLLAWLWLFPAPEPEETPAAPVETGEPAPETDQAGSIEEEPRPERPEAEDDAPAAEALAEEEVVVENELFRVVLTNQGGRVRSWRLKHYTTSDGAPLELLPAYEEAERHLPLAVDLDDASLATEINRALFQVEKEAFPSDGESPGGERVRFYWSDGRGLEVTKTIEFRRNSYLAGIEVQVVDRGRSLPVRVTLGPGFGAQDPASSKGRRFAYTGQAVRYLGGDVMRLAPRKVDEETKFGPSRRLLWAGLEEQYFAALLLPAEGDASVVIRPIEVTPLPVAGEDEEPEPVNQLTVAVSCPDGLAELYVGPKKFGLLRALGQHLEDVVWFSSYSLIYFLAKYLFLALVWIHDNMIANYGLAIILVTVALRIVFFPLNQYSMVSMRKMQTQMQKIQPKINGIKAKYRKKKDAESRAKMNQELMALYKKEGVNPAGGVSGCLPLLAQFPILFAFYNTLTVAVELRGAPFFGWITDLTLKDPFYVTPLLMGATMFLQQKMTATKMGDPTQQRMMMMMPVIFTVMFLNLPSGLVLYWFVNNLLGIGQQWLVNRHIGRLQAGTKGT
jgi:YidC/Oxa1 family membrane protein insertase